jgi:hypothetical protein
MKTDREKLMENKMYLQDIVITYNVDGSPFQNELIKFIPDMEADIRSSSVNRECTCTSKIKKYVSDNIDLFIDFLTLKVQEGILDIDFEYIQRTFKFEDLSGRIAKTTINEWGNFVKTIKSGNKTYYTFSVFKDGDDILVFFT